MNGNHVELHLGGQEPLIGDQQTVVELPGGINPEPSYQVDCTIVTNKDTFDAMVKAFRVVIVIRNVRLAGVI